jgi:ribosome biogenesis GTPase
MAKDFIFHDESDYFNTRKDHRQERKAAQKRDRSKYKKTDREKMQATPELPEKELKEGIVTSIRPQQFSVSSGDSIFVCSLRGFLKKENKEQKNLVVVGDRVLFDPSSQGEGVIHTVLERHSVLSRLDHLSQQKEHLLAANVDQLFITVSVVDPLLRPTIIDRYLIAAIKGNLHPIIICNKIDLLDDPSYQEDEREMQREILLECEKAYNAIGCPFIPVSSKTGVGIDIITKMLKDKISVFSGQSGTGKSSIINATTGLDLKVGKTVLRTRKGTHTTSSTQLLPLSFGGWCIDTPGIKSFGVWDLQEEDLKEYFVEIADAAMGCKFPDCQHLGEPGCKIPDALEAGTISPLRYESYLTLLSSLKQDHLRR